MYHLRSKYGYYEVEAASCEIYDHIICFKRKDNTVAMAMPIEHVIQFKWGD